MKKSIIIAVILALVFSLAACGGNTQANSLDVEKTAEALANGLEFDGQVEKVLDPERVYDVYGIDKELIVNVSYYIDNSAGSADEIAVFECADENAVSSVKEAVQARVQYLHDQWSGYGPAQVPKIDANALLTYGNCVVFCISNNSDNAASIIDNM